MQKLSAHDLAQLLDEVSLEICEERASEPIEAWDEMNRDGA